MATSYVYNFKVYNICKKKKKNRIAKTRLIKVKSVEDEEIIMAMAKIIITTVRMKIIIIIMMIMRIKIGNQMKI